MGKFDGHLNSEDNLERVDDLLVLDGDTFADQSGQKYRLAGINAPEIEQAIPGSPLMKQADLGGESTTQAVARIMREGGFNIIEDTGEESEDRKVIRLKNAQGQDLSQYLLGQGIVKPNIFTGKTGRESAARGRVARELGIGEDPYKNLRDDIQLDVTSMGLRFKSNAFDEQEYSQLGDQADRYYAGVDFRSGDRTLDNKALNPFTESWYTGWLGAKEGLLGASEALGVLSGVTWLEEFGEQGVAKARAQLANKPKLLVDYKDVKGVGDAFEYLGNNFIMSVPYLALLAGGSLAAPVTGGLSAGLGYGAVFGAYAGQTWGEMEGEKGKAQAAAAFASAGVQTVLDRLGLKGIIKPSQFVTEEGRERILARLQETGQAANRTQAEQLFENASKETIKDVINEIGDFSSSQVLKGLSARQVGQRLLRGGSSEMITEAAQETSSYLTAVAASDKVFDADEYTNRIINAGIAGGTIGMGFSAGGAAWDIGDSFQYARGLDKANLATQNDFVQIRETRKQEGNAPESIDNIITGLERQGPQEVKRLSEYATDHEGTRGFFKQLKEIQSIPDALGKLGRGIGKLVNASTTTYFNADRIRRLPGVSKLRGLLGQVRGAIHSGRSFEAYYDKTYSDFRNMFNPHQMAVSLGFRPSRKGYRDASKLLRRFGQEGWYDRVKNGENPATFPAEIRNKIQPLMAAAQQLEAYADNIYGGQNQVLFDDGGEPIGYTEGWWWKHQSFDARKVRNNKQEWYAFMRRHTNISQEDLDKIYDRITGEEATTIEEAWSLVEGPAYVPDAHRERTANLSEQEGWDMFAEENMFTTMADAGKQAARFMTNTKYFGRGGWKVNSILEEIRQQGASEEELAEIAWGTKSIIDAASGNFNRITNYRVAAVQRMATAISVFAGLPLSALSSIPETAMVYLDVLNNKEVIRATNEVGFQFAQSFKRGMKQIVENGIKQGIFRRIPPEDAANMPVEQGRLDKAGLIYQEEGVLTRVGVDKNNIIYRTAQERFFKAIGLTTLTQIQRRIAAAFAVDYVANRVDMLAQMPDGAEMNQAQLDAYNGLANLGLDVDRLVEAYKDDAFTSGDLDYMQEGRTVDEATMEFVDDQMQTAVYAFVNERIQNPQAANRPLFFQDPHYAMFTQFNGFISTFTANVVPRLWNDYIKRGSPRMTYNAFALMTTMVALGMASQYLKDLIKFGEPSPYLDDFEKVQRAIYSSGITGQYERAIDLVFPIYEARTRGPVDWLLTNLQGEAGPTVRNIQSVYEAGQAFAEGQTERGIDKLLRLTPASGFTSTRRAIAEALATGEINNG